MANIFNSLKATIWPSSAKHAPPRTILVNRHNKNFVSNTISNTKYNILTFIPKSLYEQFSLRMNQYFLGLAILQLWHDITPVNPISTWLPLIAILSISIAKELLDDMSRWRRDRVANLSKVTVIIDGVKKTVYSKDIRVGDIVFVKEHDEIRADIVLLKTSHSHGLAYSETAALDGERDYKERRAVNITQAMDELQLFNVEASITCEAPNPDIERFNGTITIGNNKGYEDAEAIGYNTASEPSGASSEPSSSPAFGSAFGAIPLSSLELLLQGTFLKNTDWVYGVAVYTGNETKIGKNKHTAEMKWTKTDNLINTAVIFIFLLQISIMLLLGTAGDLSMYLLHFDAFYLGYREEILPWFQPLIIPLRFLLLCSLMIPQSLKITSDIAKYMLSMFISWDRSLYDKVNNTPPAVANSNTCEELGYIKYMFTDKTGTLTENVMHFKKCVIDGKMYEETGRQTDNLLADHRIQTDIKAGNNTVTEYMRTLVLCNTVFSSVTANGTLVYRSPSPDEEALVNFAKQSEVVLEHRDYTSIRVNVLGQIEEYDIIHVLPFSSKRRRMSIIVRKKGTEDYILYAKGADDVISERISEQSMKSFKETSKYVDEFAGEGLRVLCMAMKPLREMDLKHWEQDYKRASVVLEKRTEMVEAAADKIEKDLTFLGASAIEDALQDKVPETIQALREAGIIIWMLTGDKLGTAVQIGRSCKLINDSAMTKIMHIQASSPETMEQKLNELLLEAHSVKKYKDICVVVEGVHLRHILDDSHHVPTALHRLLVDKFKQLAAMSSSVICCRVNPIQKANVVRLMKEKKWNRVRTLAVGDGGNDVAMLQEADVGVGISGKEGLQAVRAADYGVSRFKYLKRLVLIHGRNCNQKVAVMSHYTIYKSLLIAFNQLLFSMHSGFSGAPIFDGFILACYNTFFTAVLPLVFVFDNPVSDKALKNIPELYADSQKGNYINMITLALTFLFSLFQGLVFSVCTLFTFSSSHTLHQGKTLSYGDMGLISLTMIMTTHVCMVFLCSNSITFMTAFYAIAEYFLFLACSIAFSFIPLFKNTNEYYVPFILLQEPTFYCAVVLAVLVAVLPAFLYRAFIQLYNLNLTGYLQHRAPTKLDAAIAFVAPIFKDYVQYVRHKEVHQPKSARSTAFYSKLRHEIAEDMDAETGGIIPSEKTGLLSAVRKPAGYNEVRVNDSFEEI